MVEFIDQMLQAQAQSSGEQADYARQQQDLDTTKQVLENLKVQRGMINEQEKLKIDAKKKNAT
mgnify:FL=1